jgi:hypothetical protein
LTPLEAYRLFSRKESYKCLRKKRTEAKVFEKMELKIKYLDFIFE